VISPPEKTPFILLPLPLGQPLAVAKDVPPTRVSPENVYLSLTAVYVPALSVPAVSVFPAQNIPTASVPAAAKRHREVPNDVEAETALLENVYFSLDESVVEETLNPAAKIPAVAFPHAP
jgi:hypothetical protein